MFKIKDEYRSEIPQLVKNFYGMKGKIEGMVDLEAGADFLGSERSYDLALITVFENRAGVRCVSDPSGAHAGQEAHARGALRVGGLRLRDLIFGFQTGKRARPAASVARAFIERTLRWSGFCSPRNFFQKNRKKGLTKGRLCCMIIHVAARYGRPGSIAQLGEHLPYKQRVTGSSPVVPTKMWCGSSVG